MKPVAVWLLPGVLLGPVLHGARGPYDEICGLSLLTLGVAFYMYFYFTSRREARKKRAEDRQRHAHYKEKGG